MTRKLVNWEDLALLALVVTVIWLGLFEVARITFYIFVVFYLVHVGAVCAGWVHAVCRRLVEQGLDKLRKNAQGRAGGRFVKIRPPASRHAHLIR